MWSVMTVTEVKHFLQFFPRFAVGPDLQPLQNSCHRFVFGLSSRDWLRHSQTWKCFLQNHSLVAWAVSFMLEESATFHLQVCYWGTWGFMQDLTSRGINDIENSEGQNYTRGPGHWSGESWDHSRKSYHSKPKHHHGFKSCRARHIPLLMPAHAHATGKRLKFASWPSGWSRRMRILRIHGVRGDQNRTFWHKVMNDEQRWVVPIYSSTWSWVTFCIIHYSYVTLSGHSKTLSNLVHYEWWWKVTFATIASLG